MKYLLAIITILVISCNPPQRDIAQCTTLPIECEQYSCYFLGCECKILDDIFLDELFPPLYKSGKIVNSTATAKEVGLEAIAALAEPNANFKEVGEQGYGWYFITFSNVNNADYEYLTISPKGNIYLTGCGV